MSKPTGKVCFYRPKRSKPRLFSPKKLTDIYQRVCSEYGKEAAKRAVQEASCYQQTEADCEEVMDAALSALLGAAATYFAISLLVEALSVEAIAILLRRFPAGAAITRAMAQLSPDEIASQASEIQRAIDAIRVLKGEVPR